MLNRELLSVEERAVPGASAADVDVFVDVLLDVFVEVLDEVLVDVDVRVAAVPKKQFLNVLPFTDQTRHFFNSKLSWRLHSTKIKKTTANINLQNNKIVRLIIILLYYEYYKRLLT